MFAWQIFDQKVVHLLREEYRIPRITKEKADTFEALADRLEVVGGLFYHNYAGGTGLMSGAVFDRIAALRATIAN